MRLASRGLRDLDDGERAIADAEERARVRRQARRVNTKAAIFAVMGTLAVLLIPV